MPRKKANPKRVRKKANPRASENKMVNFIDELAEFEKFKEEILPAIRKDLKSGIDATSLYKKYQSLAAARGITIAMTSTNEGQALSAIKDILDRSQGKAVERKDVKHKFEDLPDEELDSLVISQWQELEDFETYDN